MDDEKGTNAADGVYALVKERDRLRDLALELARYFTSGNSVPVERIMLTRDSDVFKLLQEVLPDYKWVR